MAIQTRMREGHRLYNGGDRITETMSYSLPADKDTNFVAQYHIDAPARDFFTIPTELALANTTISVGFTEVLMREDRWGKMAVVLIDPDWDAPKDEEEAEATPIARTDAEAIAKGKRRWRNYLLTVAQAHIDNCNQIRARGGVPLEARDFTKRALREVGWKDPATAVLLEAEASKQESQTVAELKEKVEQLTKLVEGGGNKPHTAARSGKSA